MWASGSSGKPDLTTTESAELAQREAVIAKGVDTFREVGEALQEIRDQRLYRAEFGTFEAYCAGRWNMTRRYASYVIDSAEAVASLPPKLGTIVPNEATARAVAKIEPAKRAEVVEFAAARAEALLCQIPEIIHGHVCRLGIHAPGSVHRAEAIPRENDERSHASSHKNGGIAKHQRQEA
jgi:hypothetical protein